MSISRRRFTLALWILVVGLSAAPKIWAAQSVAVSAQPAEASLLDRWSTSVEYRVLRGQNEWSGLKDVPSGRHPEIEWVAQSSEYREQCEKSYGIGWEAVSAAAKSQTGEMAVVLDIDETVLLNLGFQKENADVPFNPDTWNGWVKRHEAQAVPGAEAFLEKVRGLDHVHVVFISDRASALDADTVENLKKYGMYRVGDVVLSKQDKTDNKEVRRECVEKGDAGTGPDSHCTAYQQTAYAPMKIIAKFGDSLRDHFEVYGKEAAEGTLDRPEWGTENFVLPNPMYGQWARDYQ